MGVRVDAGEAFAKARSAKTGNGFGWVAVAGGMAVMLELRASHGWWFEKERKVIFRDPQRGK